MKNKRSLGETDCENHREQWREACWPKGH